MLVWNRVRNGCSRSSTPFPRSLILAQAKSRMRLPIGHQYITLVVSSPISEIMQLFCWKQHPTHIPLEFWGCSFGLVCEKRRPYKLVIPAITYELAQHIRPQYINVFNVTDGRTDGQTNRPTTCYSARLKFSVLHGPFHTRQRSNGPGRVVISRPVEGSIDAIT